MVTCERMHEIFAASGIEYFTGVPDSTFGPWMSYLADHAGHHGHDDRLVHRMAVNEGSAIAHAAGYYLATRKLGLAYLQNAGLGNCVNPLTSLVDPEVYSIPMLLMIGWRGEPGHKDEPQHRKMGRVMLPVLDVLQIPYRVLATETAEDTVRSACELAREGDTAVALVVRKGLFASYQGQRVAERSFELSREEALGIVVDEMGPEAVVISTTGGISRESFECRETRCQSHGTDFYTVGSMGHCVAIALEIALQKPGRPVYVLDGDGALLMHMGNTATVGYYAPRNLVHVVFDNRCHESTGGQPTVSATLDIAGLAAACGYAAAQVCGSEDELRSALRSPSPGPRMVVVNVHRGSRANLGRPGLTPGQLKRTFVADLVGGTFHE